MSEVLYDDVVGTSYGQFDLMWSPDYGFEGDDHFENQVNGLVGAGVPTGVYVTFARWGGGSAVRIVRLDDAPDLGEEWEDVVEVSIAVLPGADVGWMSWAGEDGGWLDVPAGSYRLRFSARGRDAGREGEFADGIVDWYLFELWPAPAAPDEILRTTSADAACWHEARGGRR